MAFWRFKVHKGTPRSMQQLSVNVGTFVLTTLTGINHDANAICEMT